MTNLKNRTIYCKDNLDVLRGINSDSVDLIYLDPPFNKNKIFTAPIGSSAEGASFKDWFREEDVKEEWLQEIKEDYDGLYNFLDSVKKLSSLGNSKNNKHYLYNFCYLAYLSIRLIEMQRILKDTGSIYLHCDLTMSHYIKILMDIVFGEKNFRNEIIWHYKTSSGAPKNHFIKNTDTILYYSKTVSSGFNILREPWTKKTLKKWQKDDIGIYRMNKGKKYYIDTNGKRMDNVWKITLSSRTSERLGYPTQKPVMLLERIIKASSNEGDLVLDPFCGCATTCIAAEKLNRQWVGIDVSVKAYDFVRERLEKEVANSENLLQFQNEISYSTDPPKRTDRNGDTGLFKKYIYVISHPNYIKSNLYKVGIASNVSSRLNSYQTSDPLREYKVEFDLLTSNFRKVEKHIHKKFYFSHEWVNGRLEDIIKEIELFS